MNYLLVKKIGDDGGELVDEMVRVMVTVMEVGGENKMK